jgi:branched-subunit amino acid ABC-type transport system permease component
LLGWFGFGSSIAGIVGGLFLSSLADTRRLQHSLKTMIMILFIGCLLAIVWFELSVHTFFYDKPILPSTAATIGLSTALAGLFSGAATPLIFEACAEIMYPLPESLSASILVEFINITSLVLFFIAPNRYKVMNLVIIIIIAICIVLAASTRFYYKRRDADRTKRNTLIPADIDPVYDATQPDSFRIVTQLDPVLDDIQMDPIHDISYINPTLDISDA